MDAVRWQAMADAVLEGDALAASTRAREAVDRGDDLLAAVEHGFAAGLRRVGELWEEGEYFLPELVQSAEAMKAAMDVLAPELTARGNGSGSRGRVVVGTVQGDLHDIGKTLVATLLRAHGFEVHDLGADVPAARFVDVAREVGAHVVAASALLTTTLPAQAALVAAVQEAGLPARVLVGGAPTTRAWAHGIGAEWAEDALQAVQVATDLARLARREPAL